MCCHACVPMRSLRRLWTLALPGALLFLASCGQTPEETEKARGVLTGVPVVLAMSVLFVVLAVGAVGAAVVLDRTIRSKKSLVESPADVADDEDEPDEVVAGITVGRAAVPRWLYGAYVLIPVFALAYVLSNVAVAPAASEPEKTEAPSGPCTTDCAIAAAQIQFSKDEIVVAAGEPVTVAFTNNDAGVPHNFTVWESEADASAGGDPVVATATFGAGTRDAKFTAPEAGTNWYFDCTVHPASMKGEIVPE